MSSTALCVRATRCNVVDSCLSGRPSISPTIFVYVMVAYITCFAGVFNVKVFKLYDLRATRCSVGESCASGPPRCSCKALEGIKERRAGVRYSSWTCEGDLNPYETDIPSGTKCTTSCPAWRGLGDEPLVLESTCVEGNQWTST